MDQQSRILVKAVTDLEG